MFAAAFIILLVNLLVAGLFTLAFGDHELQSQRWREFRTHDGVYKDVVKIVGNPDQTGSKYFSGCDRPYGYIPGGKYPYARWNFDDGTCLELHKQGDHMMFFTYDRQGKKFDGLSGKGCYQDPNYRNDFIRHFRKTFYEQYEKGYEKVVREEKERMSLISSTNPESERMNIQRNIRKKLEMEEFEEELSVERA